MMVWSAELSSGHDGMDDQHKQLIVILNKISAALVEKNCNVEKLAEIVNDLDEYIKIHFQYEEQLMDAYAYPDVERHLLEHNRLRLRMQNVEIPDIVNREEYLSELLIYLVDWLTNHLMKVDKELGVFISMKEME